MAQHKQKKKKKRERSKEKKIQQNDTLANKKQTNHCVHSFEQFKKHLANIMDDMENMMLERSQVACTTIRFHLGVCLVMFHRPPECNIWMFGSFGLFNRVNNFFVCFCFSLVSTQHSWNVNANYLYNLYTIHNLSSFFFFFLWKNWWSWNGEREKVRLALGRSRWKRIAQGIYGYRNWESFNWMRVFSLLFYVLLFTMDYIPHQTNGK